MTDRWQFWIDVGGTFTDCLAQPPGGASLRRKVLSSAVVKGQAEPGSTEAAIIDATRRSDPEGFWIGYGLRLVAGGQVVGESRVVDFQAAHGRLWLAPPLATRMRESSQSFAYEIVSPEEAPILAIRQFLGLRLDQPIPPCAVKLGTTRGTNALLTRSGAYIAFVTTKGFADILRIGYQNRPKLFDLAIVKPEPLFGEVAEIDERIAADGAVLRSMDPAQVEAQLYELQGLGIQSLAVCLMNSYANPHHEELIGTIAREIGFHEVSLSTRVSPLMKIVPRGDTTVVDAYLNPVLRGYVERLETSLASGRREPPGNGLASARSELRLMTSSGGLVSAANFTGKDSLLSGPAGGVVGFSRVAQAAGFEKAIGFDMGGTSTDVARFDGQFEYEHETEKAGVRIVAPMLAIETVASGGGSICRWDGVKLVVGPESAGADPGPACYGRGGPLTVTDCNLLLGQLMEDHFPFPLDRKAARDRLIEIEGQMAHGEDLHPDARLARLAQGFLRIANHHMAQAIRSISLAKGYDPREYVLVPFGSAGPQHACAVADELGITRILVHPDAGVLSALGIGQADVVKERTAGVYQLLADAKENDFRNLFHSLAQQAMADVRAEGVQVALVIAALDVRYVGTDSTLTMPALESIGEQFARLHRKRYGYVHEGRPLEVVAVRATCIGRIADSPQRSEPCERYAPQPDHEWLTNTSVNVGPPLYRRETLRPGAKFSGPATVVEPRTTTIVDSGWQAEMLSGGEIVLTHLASGGRKSPGNFPTQLESPGHREADASRSPDSRSPIAPDPILLEVFNNHFTAIATQMGITLRNTATSVNVKERLDFSCAIFTPSGDLVVNAPHIPVHLGAMGQTVKQIIADNPGMQPGDVFVTNDPYRGGSHLPDVTVVTPVFASLQPPVSSPHFFTASRAHHAEIGGITPGSMPPFSKNLAEEGVLIRNFKVLDRGQSRLDELRTLLKSGPHPSRSPDTNLADITAQIAANQQGAADLQRMIEQYSLATVEAYMRHIQDAAERKMRMALARLPPGRREFTDHLDDGTPIRVAIAIAGETATIDFTGTGPVSRGNLNANRAIVTAAVMYVLRLLIGEKIPLNQGVLAPVKIVLPECILNPPERERPEDCAAVVGGNVETSQRVVDVLLGALGLAAASQGTMNNILFGDNTFGYYETVCGGSGATADAAGADAVHTHMTNTRLTDPEVLEARYPIRLRHFSIRRGSGGKGVRRGGDGVSREIEFLKPLTVSVLTQRRGIYPPYGLAGGQPGATGANFLVHAGAKDDDTIRELPGATQIEVQPGDALLIQTPGGGGYGGAGQRG